MLKKSVARLAGYLRLISAVLWVLLLALSAANYYPVTAAGPPPAGQVAPANPDFETWLQNQKSQALQPAQQSPQSVTSIPQSAERPLGLVPRPIDLRHLDRLPVTAAARLQNKSTALSQATSSSTPSAAGGTNGLPATFDWRTQGKVTPVRDQSSCGTCWAFGTMAAFESRTWIQAGSQNDFSEQNLVCCSDPSWTYLTNRRCSAGGWDFIAVDTLIKKGARLESCDPYNTSTISTAVCKGCTTSYRATGFRTVCYTAAGSEATIKDAIYNYGPVEAAFYYSNSTVYNGYIIHNPGSASSRNHLICIVGWDDAFSYGGVTGAWIIKNSWGASSGQSGYYYMTYGSSNLGDVGYFSSVGAADPNETIYYYDEAGMVSSFGYGGSSAWMADVFTATQAGRLTAADFWTTSSNAQYQINIYNGSFGSLLATQSGTCAEEGYYSIPLTSTVNLNSGQQFTVAVKLTTLGYNYPLPVERVWSGYCNPPIQTGVSFAKHYDGDAWTDMGSTQHYNACLRARVNTATADPGTQKLIGVDELAVATGGTGCGPNVALQRFPADLTGNITQIRIRTSSNGNVKAAIYADSAGSPGALINAVNTSTPVTTGWNSIPITATAVTSGSYYWLAFTSDSYIIYYHSSNPAANVLYQTYNTYSSFTFPVQAGTGWNTQSGYTYFIAGWGSNTPPAPTLPAVTNSTGATGVTATTATLNGELTSTGNANTTVHIYWGDNDGGTGIWDHDVNLGTKSAGIFSSDISGLTTGTTYYYRCYATNSAGTAWASSTSSFVVQNTAILIGVPDTATPTGGSGCGPNVALQRFPADLTGNITQIRIRTSSNGNVKAAIYADSAGSPGALINAVNTSTPVTTGWNSIPITATAVTSGSYYWLAFTSDSYIIYYHSSNPAANVLYQTYNTYSSFTFPVQAGTGWNTQSGYTYFIAGWGSNTPPAPTLPAVTNSTGATGVTATTATLNGELTSTGNANTTVHIYWGDNDGGTGIWDHDVNLGTKSAGIFSSDISGLTTGTTYYYRCYATNSAGTAWASSTSSFVVQNTAILIGVPDTATPTGGSGCGPNVALQRFPADLTGNITQIRIRTSSNGNVKAAIYADSAGSPGALINAVNTSTPVTTGWNSIPITATAVTSGSYYWLAFTSDSYIIYYHSSNPAANVLYQTYNTYSSFTFPVQAGTGWNTQSGYTYFIAGWGSNTGLNP